MATHDIQSSKKRKHSGASHDHSSVTNPPLREKPSKRKKSAKNESGSGLDADPFCWMCHKDGDVTQCVTCPRVYHNRCLRPENLPKDEDWMCEECNLLMEAENLNSRSRAMRLLTVDQLGVLLKFALNSLRSVAGVEPFTNPVDLDEFPDYKDFIVNPMDLATIEKNVCNKKYGSTEAFIGDIKWILHNCIVYNSNSSKISSTAKTLIKKCHLEMQEIENCPDCYQNIHTKKEAWFVAACRIPHLLVWAKMTGFPFWPGKAMSVNKDNQVDVRFFGAHDKAWLPSKDVYLYSLQAPNKKKKRASNLDNCSKEVDIYIKNITEKYGSFEYAPMRLQIDPDQEEEQLKMLYPSYTIPFELTRRFGKCRSESSEKCPSTFRKSSCEEKKGGVKAEGKVHDNREDEEVTPILDEVAPMSSGKFAGNEIIEDELMGSGEEDTLKDPELSSDGQKGVSDSITEKAPKRDEEAVDADRTLESPPCEVSSTTVADVEKHTAMTALDEVGENEKNCQLVDAESHEEENLGSNLNGNSSPSLIINEASEANDANDASDNDANDASEAFPTKKDLQFPTDSSPSRSEDSVQSPGIVSEAEDEVDDEEEVIEIDDVEPEEYYSYTTIKRENLSPDIEAAVIGEPDAAFLGDANLTASMTNTIEEEIDDDEYEDIRDDEGPSLIESDGLINEKDHQESNSEDPIVSENILVSQPTEIGEISPPDDDVEEPEIDDVEPDTIGKSVDDKEKDDESIAAAKNKDVDTSRLFASGVSVTVVEKLCLKGPNAEKAEGSLLEETSPQVPTDIGLGTDVSVTLVQKKKDDLAETTTDESVSNAPPAIEASRKGMISVKNQMELLQDPTSAQNILHRQNVASDVSKTRTPFPYKTVDSSNTPIAALAAVAASKVPPDPVVTISKVNSVKESLSSNNTLLNTLTKGAPSQSVLSYGANGSAPPTVSSPLSMMDQTQIGRSTMPSISPLGPLASILGAPRTSGAPYRPGGSQSMIRPNTSNSPLLRMATTVGHPSRRSPHQPTNSLPSLLPRPTFPTSGAGPVSEQLNKAVAKMTDYMRFSLEEALKDVANQGSPEALVKLLQIEMERLQYRHQQELTEVKQNYDVLLHEVRQNAEAEKQKCVSEQKKQFEVEKQKLINETKKKQWCAQCGKEAIFYCCWNTSYCDYPCQQKHWPSHMTSCAQNQTNQDEDPASTPGSDSHLDSQDRSGAASHFLGQVMKQANSRSQIGTREFPGNPSAMSFNPAALNLNPRMASQLSMRYAAAAVAAQTHPRFPGQIRFPGSYFM